MFIFPHVMTYGNASFILLQIIYGFFVAGGISLRSVILKELIPGSVAKPLAWMYFSDGLFVVLGFCFSAYVDTITPMWAYNFAGGCFVAAVATMFLLLQRYLKAYHENLAKKANEKAAPKARNEPEDEANKVEAIELLNSQNGDANPA
ncbi:unnamed protein product [Rotaria sordida]|uniref:Uncharacterized protein n=1 Tax=Rotaria sordida TaxID=392033 RepID=A0A815J320_9BILA|nr:unnamed protein product [Rotaria sordida]CAF1611801.1 unnamed protein product [Rotaria sordida]